MSDLQARFAQAQQDANGLVERPDNDTMLKLYALYKQATQGDATGERPSSFGFVRRAQFDAWSAIKGTSCARFYAAVHRPSSLPAAQSAGPVISQPLIAPSATTIVGEIEINEAERHFSRSAWFCGL